MKQNTRQNSTESTLTPKQIQVIEALASGASVTEAARRAEVDRSTVYLWMRKDANFEAELGLSRRECADTMRAHLRELGEDAVKAVREIMTGTDVSAAVRLRAALSVLQGLGAMDESRGDLAIIEKWRAGSEKWETFLNFGQR